MVQGDAKVITGGSAFNIKTKSLRMGNFTQTETQALWPQNTQATGQSFAPENFPQLWLDTESQLWLVKALGHEATWGCQPARDRSRPITLADSQQAREHLIYSRVTHPDQLCDKLRQPRVSSVMSAIIASKDDSNLHAVQPDHQPYVVDLGLIVTRPSVRISNRIYQEVIPRELTWVAQTRIANQEQSWYVTHDHRLDTPKLLAAFQQCFRQRSDIWSGGVTTRKKRRNCIMHAFLRRIFNGGGCICCEYGLRRKHTDLFIEWPTNPVRGMYGPL